MVTDQQIVAQPALKVIIAQLTEHFVITRTPENPIIIRPAVEGIVAAHRQIRDFDRHDHTIFGEYARFAADLSDRTVITKDNILAIVTVDLVGARRIEVVLTRPAGRDDADGASENVHVHTGIAEDDVRPAATFDEIAAAAAGN